MSVRRTGAVIATGALLLSACRVPNNEEPVELSGTIPFGLLETTTTTTTSIPEAVTKEVDVWLLRADSAGRTRLVPVPRAVDVAADVGEILANLFTVRPDGEERPAEAGLATSIPESATLRSVRRVDDTGRIVVDVRGLFGGEGIQGVELRNALAQIVYTATELDGVRELVFENDGVPVAAAIDNGETAEGAVDRSSYAVQS